MKITVNDNPCEIRPIWANVIQNNSCECTVTVKCHANKSFSDYEKEKLCDAIEEFLHNIPASKEETCEYILELDDFNTWKCSKCGLLWHLAVDTPLKNEMYYCPKCGRKIIREVTQN